MEHHDVATPPATISVLLADDNLIVREGVRALIERHPDLKVVGVAADYDEVIRAAAATSPQVLVTDIRMPPAFQREGIDAAKEVRKRQPGTGVVVLSQFEDPEYAVSLLAEGSAGYGYLLKDHVAEGNQLAEGVSAGDQGALRRLRLLHQAIVDREEQGETLSRLLPGGLAEKLRLEHRGIGETERVEVTVLMSDIRSYSTIAEHADPSQLAGQLNTHRAAMNRAILGEGGTVMQFVGDAVMAVFGAPFPQDDHADRAVAAAAAMHELQAEINARWEKDGLPAFGLGLGLSTGVAAAALLGSAERLEYTLVGDTVNLSQRLQQLAGKGETVASESTVRALTSPVRTIPLGAQQVKGRDQPVLAFRIASPPARPEPPDLPDLPDPAVP